MILLYTGAKVYNVAQNSYLKSLGGYISSTVVPNNNLANLFSDVSLLGMQNGVIETRAIALKNITGSTVNNVYLYHTYPVTDAKAKIEWAPITIPNSQSIEEINSASSQPYNVSAWYEPVGVSNKILIANSIPNNGVLGLWVRRTLVSPDPANAIPANQLESYLAGLSKTESIQVSIDYT